VTELKIATVNILSDLSHWEERCHVLAQGLANAGPDLIALQEVNLKVNTAAWLAEKLAYTHLHLTPKTGKEAEKEGIAILSRLPFEEKVDLDLLSQDRVAQRVRVRFGEKPLILANGHFYWQPGESAGRMRQVERLLDWLSPFLEGLPVVVCGDFNAGAEDGAIRLMRQKFRSAYATVHGSEPDYTFPTPLPRSKLAMLRTVLAYWRGIRLSQIRFNLRGPLDYIFVNDLVRVLDSRLILNQPAPGSPKIYASDHFGLLADLEIS
jgi:endonuclease/exonuclease/phosphatase family metal-dependent hydrolase